MKKLDKFDNVAVKLRILLFDISFVLICPGPVDLGHDNRPSATINMLVTLEYIEPPST